MIKQNMLRGFASATGVGTKRMWKSSGDVLADHKRYLVPPPPFLSLNPLLSRSINKTGRPARNSTSVCGAECHQAGA